MNVRGYSKDMNHEKKVGIPKFTTQALNHHDIGTSSTTLPHTLKTS